MARAGKKPRKRSLGSRIVLWGPTRLLIELWLRLAALWLTLPGPRWAYFWVRVAVWWAWLLMPRLRGVTLRNVDLCFPEKPLAERTRIARASARHFGYTFLDCLLAPRYITDARWREYFAATPDDHPYLQWFFEDKPAFNLSAHFGNWEIASWNVGRLHRDKLLVLAKQLRPPLVNRWVVHCRRALGNEVIEADGGAKAYMRAIKERRRIAVLVDQNGGRDGPAETFFGIPCTWQADFTRLCLRGGGRLAHTFARRVGEQFRFEFLQPRMFAYPPETDPMQLMRDYRDHLEQLVRENPEQYFWMHRRFKATKPGWGDAYADLGTRWGVAEREALITSRAARS
ncbi:MAG: lysophospholipid acyltransferase family protein [Planctomycetes bacterium]|nr:lysophospholipid acyltransferase family protein [Planctomycetota bacterium]MCL4731833.1 lysophospholipid acyltransferase family protein [Planctomycetota bacterium]